MMAFVAVLLIPGGYPSLFTEIFLCSNFKKPLEVTKPGDCGLSKSAAERFVGIFIAFHTRNGKHPAHHS